MRKILQCPLSLHRVIYVHGIKKIVGYAYAIKKVGRYLCVMHSNFVCVCAI
jgi:hypothetical protein